MDCFCVHHLGAEPQMSEKLNVLMIPVNV